MAERLALGTIPGTGWRAGDIQDVARAAEDAGFEAVFCAEVNNDAIATAQLMGFSTKTVKVGTWVAHILFAASVSVRQSRDPCCRRDRRAHDPRPRGEPSAGQSCARN